MNDEMKEVKPIILTDNANGAEYTLEFNRNAVKFAEERGFSLDDISKFPMTKIPEFFYYAFYMHHRGIPKVKTDALLDGMGGIGNLPENFLARLAELYAAPFNTLTDGKSKNVTVSVKL